jgi:hypothetical protein
MVDPSILTSEFDEAAAEACRNARAAALAAGRAVVFADREGRYLKELPDGSLFEVRLDPNKTGELHCVVLGELSSTAA